MDDRATGDVDGGVIDMHISITGETQILLSWNCSAHCPGRASACVLYLHDSSAHCICYRNLSNMVVAENTSRIGR